MASAAGLEATGDGFWKRYWALITLLAMLMLALGPPYAQERAAQTGRAVAYQCLQAEQARSYEALSRQGAVSKDLINSAINRDRELGPVTSFRITYSRGAEDELWTRSWNVCAEVVRGSKKGGECLEGTGDRVEKWRQGPAFPFG